MHGNFNEMITTVITEESEAEAKRKEPESQDVETIKFEMDVSIPSFEVEIMKLKLVPGLGTVADPA